MVFTEMRWFTWGFVVGDVVKIREVDSVARLSLGNSYNMTLDSGKLTIVGPAAPFLLSIGNGSLVSSTVMEVDENLDLAPAAGIWMLNSIATFERGPEGWSHPHFSVCGISSDIFLGGHCKLGGLQTVWKQFKDLPAHEKVRITARVHMIDLWEGEVLFMRVDGVTVWQHSHHWCREAFQSRCRQFMVNACGSEMVGDKLSQILDVEIFHNETKNLVSNLFTGEICSIRMLNLDLF